MKRKLKILTVASGIACLCALILLIVSYQLDVWKHGITVTQSFHVGLFDGAVWFYGDKLPYHGGMLRVGPVTDNGVPYPGGLAHEGDTWCIGEPGEYNFGWKTYVGERGEEVGRDTGCDLPGVYYRHFVWTGEPTIWSLMISLWYPILLLAVLPAVWFFSHLRLRRTP